MQPQRRYQSSPMYGFMPTQKDDRETVTKAVNTFREGVKQVKMQSKLLTFTVITNSVSLSSEGYDRLSEAHFFNGHTTK